MTHLLRCREHPWDALTLRFILSEVMAQKLGFECGGHFFYCTRRSRSLGLLFQSLVDQSPIALHAPYSFDSSVPSMRNLKTETTCSGFPACAERGEFNEGAKRRQASHKELQESTADVREASSPLQGVPSPCFGLCSK